LNRNLFVFAILLVILGIGFNIYLLSLFGLLLLIPAVLVTSRPPVRPAPVPPKQEVRRITSPPVQRAEVIPPTPPPRSMMPATLPAQPQTYSPALFPTSMFPSISQVGTQPQPPREAAPAKPSERDELVEAGAILVLLRLLSG